MVVTVGGRDGPSGKNSWVSFQGCKRWDDRDAFNS
jgi:hypothetical protein